MENVTRTLKSILKKDTSDFISLHEPKFGGNELKYLKECIDTGWVSTAGQFVSKFETTLAAYTGTRFAIATVNGTAALHICLKLVGVITGDEVLIPTLTFVATANAVAYCSAIPHFVDCSESTLGLCPEKLADYLQEAVEVKGDNCINKITGNRIKACIPMHTYGHAVDLDPLMELCSKYKIEMIEDAAESLGSFYKGRHTGNWGKVAAISLNGNKIITSGGGGAILTNSREIAEKAKHLTTTAKVPHMWKFRHDVLGYNYRMPNINAALGCAQMEQLSQFLNIKRSLAKTYEDEFKDVKGVCFFKEPSFSKSNYWINVLLLDEKEAYLRNTILNETNDAGIMTRPAWSLMHTLPMYESCPKMNLSVAENLERRIINIPSSAALLEQ